MEAVVQFIEAYGLWVVFFAVLLDQGGLPLPAYPVIIVTAALAVTAGESVPAIGVVAVIGVMIADIAWFYGGRLFGGPLLRLMCRLSLSPDSCVSLTRRVYSRWGAPSLIAAKYIPGFAAVATTLAGEARTSLGRFLLFDTLGAALWVAGAVALGVIFNDAVDAVLLELEQLGHIATIALIAAVAIYVLVKWWKRQLFLSKIRMPRTSANDLRALMDSAAPPLVLDVRSPDRRAQDGWIPGSVPASQTAEPDCDRASQIVTYCDCPNDASAAVFARRLLDAGFLHVSPLAGGFGTWRKMGFPIQRGNRPIASPV